MTESKTRNSFEQYILEGINEDKAHGVEVFYERTSIPYRIEKNLNYKVDFDVVKTNSGKTIYIESKGFFRIQDIVKMKAVKASNPTLDIRMVFAKDNKLPGAKRKRYSDWCFDNGFPFAIGRVPREWLQE